MEKLSVDQQVEAVLRELAEKKIIKYDFDNYVHSTDRICKYACGDFLIHDSATQEEIKTAFEKEDKWRNPNEGFHFDRLNEIKVVDGKLHWTLSVKPGSRRVNALTDYGERGWFRYSGIVEVDVNEIFPMIQKIAKLTYLPTALTVRRHWDAVLQILTYKIYNQYIEMDPIEPWEPILIELLTHIIETMSDYGRVKLIAHKRSVDDVADAITDFANKIVKPLGIPYSDIRRMVETDKQHNERDYYPDQLGSKLEQIYQSTDDQCSYFFSEFVALVKNCTISNIFLNGVYML